MRENKDVAKYEFRWAFRVFQRKQVRVQRKITGKDTAGGGLQHPQRKRKFESFDMGISMIPGVCIRAGFAAFQVIMKHADELKNRQDL